MSEELQPTSRPSQSGARLTGDDVQHLIAWYWCLKTLIPGSGVKAITVEADDAGNLDDVVVDLDDGRRLYHQVKAAVSARRSANINWLCEPTGQKGISLLQRLHGSWVNLGRPPGGISLITSRPLDPQDLVLKGLDRMNHVGQHLRRATNKELVSRRKELAGHLGCDEGELCDLFDALELHLGQTEGQWRRKVDDVALGAGVRIDNATLGAALSNVRDWIKTTRDPRDARAVAAAVDRLGIRAEPPRAVVVVQALDVEPAQDDAAIVIDWVARFRGDQPETRRGLRDPLDWNGALADDLTALRTKLREQNQRRILVRGSLRLPCWFAVGAALREVAGFEVAMSYANALWVADTTLSLYPEVRVLVDDRTGSGDGVALVVAVSTDATDDVRSSIAKQADIGRLVTITVDGGPQRRLFQGPDDAMAAAVAVREWARRLTATDIHIVLAGPAPFALFLGHLWDRVPPTTIYEDLAPGYEAAFHFRP